MLSHAVVSLIPPSYYFYVSVTFYHFLSVFVQVFDVSDTRSEWKRKQTSVRKNSSSKLLKLALKIFLCYTKNTYNRILKQMASIMVCVIYFYSGSKCLVIQNIVNSKCSIKSLEKLPNPANLTFVSKATLRGRETGSTNLKC